MFGIGAKLQPKETNQVSRNPSIFGVNQPNRNTEGRQQPKRGRNEGSFQRRGTPKRGKPGNMDQSNPRRQPQARGRSDGNIFGKKYFLYMVLINQKENINN